MPLKKEAELEIGEREGKEKTFTVIFSSSKDDKYSVTSCLFFAKDFETDDFRVLVH